jgi:hypothetical protein
MLDWRVFFKDVLVTLQKRSEEDLIKDRFELTKVIGSSEYRKDIETGKKVGISM